MYLISTLSYTPIYPQWLTGIRKAPKMTGENWKELAPVGVFTALAHAFSVLALGAGTAHTK